jgi:hypothetical protein
MAVAYEAVVAAVARLTKAAAVVAMQQGDPHAGELEVAKVAVTSLPGRFDRRAQRGMVLVTIAEHEMRRPRRKQLDNVRRANVAGVQHGFDLQTFEQSYRRPSKIGMPMRIADNA